MRSEKWWWRSARRSDRCHAAPTRLNSRTFYVFVSIVSNDNVWYSKTIRRNKEPPTMQNLSGYCKDISATFCYSTETVLNGALVEKRRWDTKEIRHPFAPVCAICFSFPSKKRHKKRMCKQEMGLGLRVTSFFIFRLHPFLFLDLLFFASLLPFFSSLFWRRGPERLERGVPGLGLLFLSSPLFFLF